MTKTFTFPGCWVHVDLGAQYLATVFPDGAQITSVPVPEKDSATARRYGYGDDWLRLWCEHDLLHHWVAAQFGEPYSPTLWSECHDAHPDALPMWARLEEEEFVAEVHRWLNGGEWTSTLWPLTTNGRDLDAMRVEAMRVLRHEQTEIKVVSPAGHCG